MLSHPEEGRRPSSLNVGMGCGGRFDVRRVFTPDETPKRTAKSCGPGAAMLALSLAEFSQGDGDNKPAHRGEHEVSRKAIAQGMSECFRSPVCSCAPNAQFLAHETAGAACTRHSLRPLLRERGNEFAKLGRNTPRDRGRILFSRRPCESGTHTPRRMLIETVVDDFARAILPCGYGSLLRCAIAPRQGRQRAHITLTPPTRPCPDAP